MSGGVGKIKVKISVSRDEKAKKFDLPHYETEGSAGVDLRSTEEVLLLPGERALVPTGLRIAIPVGFEAQVRPRSGLALKYGVTVMNSPGTIDSDYRGEVKVILANSGDNPFTVNAGDRIAQMIFAPVVQVAWEEKENLDETARGEGGFGSTGGNKNAK